MNNNNKILQAVTWDDETQAVVLLDQRALPDTEKYIACQSVEQVANCIENMTVRGAPAIGITAAYGIALAALNSDRLEITDNNYKLKIINQAFERLAKTRPTAVNLFTALERMRACFENNKDNLKLNNLLLEEAKLIHDEDIANNKRMGEFGAKLLPDDAVILTHCNAGAIATGGHGTALGVLRSAREAGKKIKVYADETRPLFQGARLTAWELARDNFDVTLITDSMAGALMKSKKISAVIVGADRIAKNGDTANKIGTYGLSVIAKAHGVPFYIAAPFTTLDFKAESGADIPIEERSESEMRILVNNQHVPDSVKVWNPAFDVTPSENITAIITERGVFFPPFKFEN